MNRQVTILTPDGPLHVVPVRTGIDVIFPSRMADNVSRLRIGDALMLASVLTAAAKVYHGTPTPPQVPEPELRR